MRYAEIAGWQPAEPKSDRKAVSTGEDILDLPVIEVGDEIVFGKFKNRRAVVKGFTTDKHNQPVLKTSKGDQPLFKPRLVKLMPRSNQSGERSA